MRNNDSAISEEDSTTSNKDSKGKKHDFHIQAENANDIKQLANELNVIIRRFRY